MRQSSGDELERTRRERDVNHASRLAAEQARDLAESARDVAEEANDVAGKRLSHLEARLEFLEEQLQSTRVYLTDAMRSELADLQAQSDAQRQEISVLSEELADRTRPDAGRTALHVDVDRGS